MKKYLLLTLSSLALLFVAFTAQAQDSKMDADPDYKQFNQNCILDKVEYRKDRTIFHFRYKASNYTSIWLYSPVGDHPWFLKDKINGEEYNLLGVFNVRKNNQLTHKEVSGNYVYLNADREKTTTYFECEVHFERLPEKVSEVDLIEGKGMEEAWNHFHCFNIKVAPLKEKLDLVVEPIQLEDIVIAQPVDPLKEVILPIDVAVSKTANNNSAVEETSTSSENASLVSFTQDINWSVFPTPATNVIHFKQTEAQKAQLSIVNLGGQLLWNGRIQGTARTINVSKLVSGTYILLHTIDGNTSAQKIMIK